jgi:membrane protein implicated in regulation of membrane protease activity
MTWETFYLICFLAGLFLSAFTLLGGMGHFGGHVHIPHAPHVPHALHVPHAGHPVHGAVPSGNGAASSAQAAATVPWWNAFSIMIFLCWFGAAGYLLSRYGSFVAGVVLVLAAVCGVAGGAIIFFFLTKVLLPHEHELTADETEVVGAVGHVSSAIRPTGTGEIVYEQLGALRSAPARSEDGISIPKQEEVYVVRYDKGIAYVRRWEEMENSDQLSDSGQGPVNSDQSDAAETARALGPRMTGH